MHKRVLLALELVVLGLAGWQLWTVGAAVAARNGFGFDIEWMEGATLVSAMRVRDGLPIYGEPALDYIPFIYPPLYAWLVGALAHVFPLGYTLGRTVSAAGSAAACLALVLGARRLGARWPLAIACAALFASTYEECGSFFDLVRTDGLSIGLLGSAVVLAAGRGRGAAIGGGVALALAFACKHHAAMFGIAIALVLWRRDGWRQALTFGLAAAVPALAFVIGMQVATEGRFLTWILGVPATHGMDYKRLFPWIQVTSVWPWRAKTGGAAIEVWKALPVTTSLALLAALLLPLWRWRSSRRGALLPAADPPSVPLGWYWIAVTACALVVVSLMRGHTGGFMNVLIPMFWVEAMLPAVVLAGAARVGWRWAPHLVSVVVAAQLWQGRDDVSKFVPTPGDTAAGEALIAKIRELPEPVLLPHAPWYAVLAGKEPSFALICLWDIDYKDGPFKPAVARVDRSIRRKHWASAVLPDDKLKHGLKDYYKRQRGIAAPLLKTRTGWGVKLNAIWEPQERRRPGSAGTADPEKPDAPPDPDEPPPDR